jgi:hypothetical protein
MPWNRSRSGAFLLFAGGSMTPGRGDGYLSTPEVARMLGVKPSLVRKWRQRGHIVPDGLDEAGRPLYSRETARRADRLVRENGLRTSGVDPRVLRTPPAARAA